MTSDRLGDPARGARRVVHPATGAGGEAALRRRRPSRGLRTPAGRRHRRFLRRRVMPVIAVLLVPVVWSYVRALTGPGSDSLGAKSVEWLREHHLGSAVDAVERRWYQSHQAKVGGTPDVSVARPIVVTAGGKPSPTSVPQTVGPTVAPAPSAGPAHVLSPVPASTSSSTPAAAVLAAPGPLQSPASPPVSGEGVWSPLGPSGAAGAPGAFATLIRPDDVHTSILDAVVWIDPRVLALREYPGAKTPGAPWDRPDHVEADRQQRLVAAFAGGFRLADSRGGMELAGKTLAPLRAGAATLAIDTNGVPQIGAWGRDVDPHGSYDSVRQNLDLIVDGGAPVANLTSDPNRKWGFTGPLNKSAVWRSGAGITADGALVWVGGPGLTIETLAGTLVRAGAIRGMQLDINHEWVELNTYAVAADGTVHGARILPGMEHSDDRWLSEDSRDFIGVFQRTA